MNDSRIDSGRRRFNRALLAAPIAGALSACGDATQRIEDVTRLEWTDVAEVAHPTTTEAVSDLLRRGTAPVSIGGGRFSMGGQIAWPDSLHLDMRAMRRLLELDVANRRVRVQAGMRWRDLQALIDPHDLSVAIMQSYSNFTVGGSLSVNCHGRYVGRGPLINSVRALRLVTSEGETLELDRDTNADLFRAVCGGYGGLGVVTEVELDLEANARIVRAAEYVPLDEYPVWFRERVRDDADAVLHNADLLPPHFGRPLAITWRRTDAPVTLAERLIPEDRRYSRDQSLIWAASELPIGEEVRDRKLTRRQLTEHPVVWRNREASLDADALEPRTRAFSTYLLQEYFIPVAQFRDFVAAMRKILMDAQVNALNVSIRHSSADRTSLLSWAPQEAFSFVLYYKQRSHRWADAEAARWTQRLIDAALANGGRYYLPYRLHATPEQFLRAYPEAEAFAALKARHDPKRRFRNKLLERYLPR
ncbi:MAG: FAD-binding oxidoreductase [Xanthomonadaceae bacterium]|nr:FAD-binding oxidoreductase [Xanthomonadaceae bacterium]